MYFVSKHLRFFINKMLKHLTDLPIKGDRKCDLGW